MVHCFLKKQANGKKNNKYYFEFILENSEFQKIIKKARTNLGLQEGNLPSNFKDAKIYSKSEEYANEIIATFGMPESWKEPLRLFIVTGVITSPCTGIYLSGLTLKWDSELKKFIPPASFSITVTEKMGYTNLLRLIRERKDYIQEYLKMLPKGRRRIGGNIEMKLEIYRLREDGKSVNEILDFLTDKYDQLAPAEGTLRVWIRRIQKFLRKETAI